jgi:hypothetical protein
MPTFDSAETLAFKRESFATEARILISQDDVRQDAAGYRMLYVLGFGIAGAIFANGAVFAYFALFYGSGANL